MFYHREVLKKNRSISWVLSSQLIIVALLLTLASLQFTASRQRSDITAIEKVEAQILKPSKPKPKFTFPGGERTLLPNYRLIALYGTPGTPVLGVLGAQGPTESIDRVKKLAALYQPLMTEKAYPTFEIIATVASEFPTEDNDYSREVDTSQVAKWIQLARDNGVYVILDLQSGRTDFLTQAKKLEPFLKEPNVGLALDPEWRLKPNQVPLVQIGDVDISEVNATSAWLANLVKVNKLPQKIFLLHQFRVDMLPNRQNLDTSHSELSYLIQMDGQGSQPSKNDTWQALLANPPANVYFGWKNFTEKDEPMLTPEQTMAITPRPWYVSYQ